MCSLVEPTGQTYLTQSAETGNQYAQYALGKLYLDSQDREQAHYWFTRSAAQGNEYAQFFLERWELRWCVALSSRLVKPVSGLHTIRD